MQNAAAYPTSHVVQHTDLLKFAANRYAGWHASAPILTALAVAAIIGCGIAVVFIPAALAPILLGMAILMIGAAVLAFFSLIATGEIIQARFDRTKQIANFIYRGPVAHTEWVLPFARISSARMAIRYDERGNKIATPTLDLVDGRQIVLPKSTTWSDIEAIRAMFENKTDVVAEAWARKADKRNETFRGVRRSKAG